MSKEDCWANPKNRETYEIKNTIELFKWGSFNGGVWRAGYKLESIGLPSVLIHFLGGPAAFLRVAYAFLAAIGYYVQSAAFLNSQFVVDGKVLLGI